jgi:hypothetical protein
MTCDMRTRESRHITASRLFLRTVLWNGLTVTLPRIPRDAVEEINRVVMRKLDSVMTGLTSTIVGGYDFIPPALQTCSRALINNGYRRRKPESNDVGIVITHKDEKME